MKLSLKNIHKPTSAKMSKIAAACVAASTVISTWAAIVNDKPILYFGLFLGVAGAVLPTLIDNNNDTNKTDNNNINNSNGVGVDGETSLPREPEQKA